MLILANVCFSWKGLLSYNLICISIYWGKGMDKAFAVLQHYVAMFEHINIYELYKIYILLSNSQVDHKLACHFLVHVLHVLKHFGIAQQTQPMVDVVSLAFNLFHTYITKQNLNMMIYYCTLRGCPNLAGDSGYLILIWLLISQNSIGITAPTGHSCEMIYGCKKEFF